MTDKQIIGGRGSAKSYTTLNTIEVMLENEKLKEALKRKEQECEELKETFDGLFKVQYKLADNNKKLRQCLTEIKEIAEEYEELHGFLDCSGDLILQKISECEVENE